MKVERKADHAVGEDSARAATGKSLSDWFKTIDAKGGTGLGRRETGTWMVAELIQVDAFEPEAFRTRR
jgi:hypothetical protein